MTTAAWQAIGVGLGTLLVALLTYLSAALTQHTAALRAAAALTAAQMESAKRSGRRKTDPPAGGAGGRGYPRFNQLVDPLPTGALPAQRANECGEECVAEVIYMQHGVPLAADAIRALIHGAAGPALTTGPDLVQALSLGNVAAELIEAGADQVQARLLSATAAHRSAICLGYFVSPEVLHWVLVTRADAAGCSYNDPWGGLRVSLTWPDFRGRYQGTMVEPTRAPDV